MNDLEICRRIAEIEGLLESIDDSLKQQREMQNSFKARATGVTNPYRLQSFEDVFNPLNSDSASFKLMVKYGIKVTPRIGYTLAEWSGGEVEANGDKHTNRAICLAIIEAFKTK